MRETDKVRMGWNIISIDTICRYMKAAHAEIIFLFKLAEAVLGVWRSLCIPTTGQTHKRVKVCTSSTASGVAPLSNARSQDQPQMTAQARTIVLAGRSSRFGCPNH